MRLLAWVATASLFAACLDTSLPSSPLRGRVVGTLDASKGKLSHAGQEVVMSGETGVSQAATTDATGAFVFADVPPGLYLVSVSLNGYAKVSSDLLRVRSGRDTDAGTLVPESLSTSPQVATLVGKVSGKSGQDITGATVQFLYSGVVFDSATLAADGVFRRLLPPGTLTIHVTHPAFITKDLTDVVLEAAQTRDLTQEPMVLDVNPATLSGTVLRERDGLSPEPASGAAVQLVPGDNAIVDPAGHFIIGGQQGGEHHLDLSQAGYHDPDPSRTVTLVAGEPSTLEPVTLLLDRGSIVGTVKLADGASVSGARVEVVGTNSAALVSPDPADPSQGGFVLAGVPVGSWSVVARKEQYSNSTTTVVVSRDLPVSCGVLTLARLFGDFTIADGDSHNTPGYTRTLSVELDLSGFPSTGVASWRASEDSAFTGVAFAPYTGRLQPFTLASGDGVHTVYAQYTDTNGQVSQTFSASVVLDQTPPTLSSVAFDATGTDDVVKYTNVAQGLSLRVVADDGAGSGLALMRVGDTLDGLGDVAHATEAYTLTPVLSRSATGDGAQRGYVQVIDHAGNPSAVGHDDITVDTQPPTGSIALGQGPKATEAGYTNSPFVSVSETWADSGDAGVVLVKLANRSQDLGAAVYQPTASTQGWFLDPSAEGDKTVYARFRDVAGNETVTPATDGIVYDVTPPNPASATLLSAAITNSLAVTLSLTTNPADLSTAQALTLSDEATFTSSATTSPMAFPANAQASFTLPSGDGVRSVFVRFKDKSGNEAVTSAQVTVDTVPPTGSFTLTGFLADGTASSTLTATNLVTVNLVPQGATLYRLGDASMTACPATGYAPVVSTTLVNQLLPASGVITLCLRDAAGNLQGPLSQSLTLDAAGPTGCALALTGTKVDGSAAPAGRTASRAVTAAIASCTGATEMALVEGAVSCVSGSLSWVPFAASSGLTLGGTDGARTINGCARDAARNVAAVPGASITLDTQGPTAPAVVVDNGAATINAAAVAQRGGTIGHVTGSAQAAVSWALSEDAASFPAAQVTGATDFTFAGAGLRTLYARFFDDVGNQSAIASAQVTIDVEGPVTTGVTLALLPPPGAQSGYTHDANLQLALGGAPADAVGVKLAWTLGASCPTSLFTAVPVRALQSVVNLQLGGGDGLKYVCLQLLDAAQNPSVLSPLAVTLDTLPPTAPSVVTAPQLLNATAAAAFTVTTSGPVVETNFERYEHSGGSQASWTSNGTTDLAKGTTSFDFTLVANRTNVLQLRAVDKAGNVSPADSVAVTWDAVAPTAPVMKEQWVDNGSERSTLYWRTSVSPDVVAYNVYYGPVKGTTSGSLPTGFFGASAAEGPSPVRVAANGQADQAFTLSGLIDSSTLYSTVTAIDQAGNESAAPAYQASDLPDRQVQAAPNIVSPNRVAKLSLGNTAMVSAIAVQGQYAYLAASQGGLCSAGGQVSGATPYLAVVDLSSFAPALSAGHINLSPSQPTLTWGPTSLGDTMVCTANAPYQPGLVDVLVDGEFLFVASGSKVRIYSLRTPATPSLLTTIDLAAYTPIAQQLALVGDRLFVGGDPTIVALSLSRLYDANAATLPGVANVIGTSAATGGVGLWATGMGLSRDRLVQLARNSGGNAGTLVGSALTASPTFSTAANFVSPASQVPLYVGLSNLAPVTSGNYLYLGTYNDFRVYRLNGLWSSTTAGPGLVTADRALAFSAPTSSALEVAGHQLFSAHGTQLRSVDLSDITAPALSGYSSLQTVALSALKTYGNHLLVGGYGELQILELATPRTLHEVASATTGGSFVDVAGGLLYTGNGLVHDLHGGTLEAVDTLTVPAGMAATQHFLFDQTRFDSTLVTAQGAGGFLVATLEKLDDRDPATHLAAADALLVPHHLAGTRVTGVRAAGNFLVAAEVRADGVWLEVFDARALRNRQGLATFAPASATRGSFRVASFTPSATLWVSLNLANGRAIVALEDAKLNWPPPTQPSPGLYVVDLRNLLDDAAASTVTLLASLPLTSVRQAIIRGGWLYAAGGAGLTVVDVKELMQEPPAALPASPVSTSLALGSSGLDSVAVYGSYLFAADHLGSLVHALDVHTPTSPFVISVAPVPSMGWSSHAPSESDQFYLRSNVAVAGSRLYYSHLGEAHAFELE